MQFSGLKISAFQPYQNSFGKKAIVCFIGPSGVGKSAIIEDLLKQGVPLQSSSITSRDKRPDDGETYSQHNVPANQFIDSQGKIKFDDFFLITQKQNDKGLSEYFASPKKLIESINSERKAIAFNTPYPERLFEMAKSGYKMMLVLIKPPGTNPGEQIQALSERLKKRGDLPEDVINERVKDAGREMVVMDTFAKVNQFHPSSDITVVPIINDSGELQKTTSTLKEKIQSWWQSH